jgi:hypothetical protein
MLARREIDEELAVGIRGPGGLPELLLAQAQEEQAIVRVLLPLAARREPLQVGGRSLIVLELKERHAQGEAGRCRLGALGKKLEEALELRGRSLHVLAPKSRPSLLEGSLARVAFRSARALVQDAQLQRGQLAALDLGELLGSLEPCPAVALAKLFVDGQRSIPLRAGVINLRSSFRHLRAQILCLFLGLVFLPYRRFDPRALKGDGAPSGDEGESRGEGHETEIGHGRREPGAAISLVDLVDRGLDLRVQVLQEIVRLDDQVARLEHFLA